MDDNFEDLFPGVLPTPACIHDTREQCSSYSSPDEVKCPTVSLLPSSLEAEKTSSLKVSGILNVSTCFRQINVAIIPGKGRDPGSW